MGAEWWSSPKPDLLAAAAVKETFSPDLPGLSFIGLIRAVVTILGLTAPRADAKAQRWMTTLVHRRPCLPLMARACLPRDVTPNLTPTGEDQRPRLI